MTTEVRQIFFQQTEVCAAIQDYRRRRNEPLPTGSIMGITFGNQPDINATLKIQAQSDDSLISVILPSEALAAALILFCINRKIPLPAKAQKKLQRIDDSVGLLIKQELRGRQNAA